MKLQDNIDFATLNWVKGELDETLRQAFVALEAHVEDPTDHQSLRSCKDMLHQVQGTLRMIELYGAAMVIEEMEQLVQGLLDDEVGTRDDAYSVLMRGMVQLPDYLERLQGGHKDIPIVLLPLLNDLRACRGQTLLSESVLFASDLDVALPESLPRLDTPLAASQQKAAASRLRLVFQSMLLRWIRDDDGAAHAQSMAAVLDRLLLMSATGDARRLWWIGAGVAEAVHARALPSSVALKLLFGRLDRAIGAFAEDGEMAIRTNPGMAELAQSLLYYTGQADSDLPRIRAVQQTFQLDSMMPSERELEHAHGSMTGHNRDLLDTVSAAIKEDLVGIKELLDIYLRTSADDPERLQPLVERIDRVGDTLGMLGLGAPRRVVAEQRDVIADIASGTREADESVLLDVAGALLYVESSLDDHIERLGADSGAEAVDSDDADRLQMPRAEVRKLLGTLTEEAAANIQRAKQAMVAFIEANWSHEEAQPIPMLLEQIGGAMRMLELEPAAALVDGIVRFVDNELLQRRRTPSAEQMDHLADALASIEYYVEAIREQRSGRERILDVTRASLDALGYWPVPPRIEVIERDEMPDGQAPEAAAPTAPDDAAQEQEQEAADIAPDLDPAADLESFVVSSGDDADTDEIDLDGLRFSMGEDEAAEVAGDLDAGASAPDDDDEWVEVEETVEIDDEPAVDGAFQSADTDFDDIREIFLEEIDEEIESQREQLPIWRADIENLDKLVPIRRSYHTLKGSGRLVGAQALAEMSWRVEDMLNRALEGSINITPQLQELLDHALAALPALREVLAGLDTPMPDVNGIMDVAERLAKGEIARLEDRPRATRTEVRKVRRRVPRVEEPAPVQPVASHQIDPVLFDILRNEVRAHLQSIDGFHASCLAEPQLADEGLMHAVHTLNGAIAMVDIPVIGRVLSPLEGYVRRLRSHQQVPDAEGVDALGEVVTLVDEAMRCLEHGDAAMPDSAALAQRLIALRDSLPEPRAAHHEAIFSDDDALDAADDPALPVETGTGPVVEVDGVEQADDRGVDIDDDAQVTWLVDDDDQEGVLDEADVQHHPMSDDDLEIDLTASLIAQMDEVPDAPAADPLAGEVEGRMDDADADADDWMTPTVRQVDAGKDADAVDAADADEERRRSALETLISDIQAQDSTPDADEGHEQPAAQEEPLAAAPESLADTDVSMADDADAAVQDGDTAETTDPLGEAVEAVDDGVEHGTSDDVAAVPLQDPEIVMADDGAGVEIPIAEDVQPDAPLDVPDLDDDLLEIFVQEGSDILDHSDTLMAQLRETPHAIDIINGLQRDLHTLKGGARMAGLMEIGDLGHAMESLLDAVVEARAPMDRVALGSLQHGFDLLHEFMQRVSARRALSMPLNALARFEQLVTGTDLVDSDDVVGLAATRLDQEAATGQEQPREDSVDEPVAAERPAAPLTPWGDEAPLRAPQEMIRVRSELLDALVNQAGEVSIYRSRLEQQVSTFRFNLVELEQTVTRLREQLRALEMETEAQIIARYQREQKHEGGEGVFDPLELDRFSQLQEYSRALGESVADLVSIQALLDDNTRESETLLLQQSRVSSELQEGLMRTRMVPFDSIVPSLRRTVRHAAQELEKSATLRVEGAQGEMDRNLLERMKAPFEHLLRNAVTHGIESPDTRAAANKPAEGTINIAVSRESTEVLLRISDDGAGLDRDAIRRRAVARGLLAPDAKLSDSDIYGFILESGFSTAESVTQLAGRGVGMDVVHTEIKQLGGSLQIDSEPGKGTSFTLRLPFTLAMTQAILVRLGDVVYALPMASVQGVVRIGYQDYMERMASDTPTYGYNNEEYQIHELARLLGVPGSRVGEGSQLPLVMLRSGDQRAAVRIDAVVGSHEVVVKPVGPQISSVPGIFGATIMGDGSVVMILDLAPLVRRANAQRAHAQAEGEVDLSAIPVQPVDLPEEARAPLVMVVDDSITMRKVTSRVLERAEMSVLTAKDGLDAVEKLQDTVPDLMLLDIEMPRMDGFELATYMRNDSRLKDVPIIMITSRTGEKHRQRALEIGVEHYLGKPYQEADLLKHVHQMLEVSRV